MTTSVASQPCKGVYRFTVSDDADQQRLDQFLGGCRNDFSRTLARKLIELGGVHLDGRRMRRSGQIVSSGQRVEVYIDGLPLQPYMLSDDQILYRDDNLIVIDKPAGVATQPTPARYRGTLYDALLRELASVSRSSRKPSVGMVQRLDRDTSGVIVFSIHQRAHKELSRLFRENRVEKRYWALVAGASMESEGEIRSNLARRRSTNRTVSVEKGGKPAVTRYRTIESWGDASLLEVELITGRTHQIRCHFSEAGFPLLGDTFYNGPATVAGFEVPRHMLHARELAFDHPVTGEPLQFEAPFPNDFEAVMAKLKGT